MLTFENLKKYREALQDAESFREYADKLAAEASNVSGTISGGLILWDKKDDQWSSDISKNLKELTAINPDTLGDLATVQASRIRTSREGLRTYKGDKIKPATVVPHYSNLVHDDDEDKKAKRIKQSELSRDLVQFLNYFANDDALDEVVLTRNLILGAQPEPLGKPVLGDNDKVRELADFMSLAGLQLFSLSGKAPYTVEPLSPAFDIMATPADLLDAGWSYLEKGQPIDGPAVTALICWREDALTTVTPDVTREAVKRLGKVRQLEGARELIQKAIQGGTYSPDIYRTIVYDWLGCEVIKDPETGEEYAVAWLKALLSTIYRNKFKAADADAIPAIFWMIGGQGLGKSTFGKLVGLHDTYTPESDPESLSESKRRDFNKESSARVLTVFDDKHIADTTKKVEYIKSAITEDVQTVREVYTKTSRKITNRMTWLSTSNNNQEFMGLGRGVRRFFPLTVANYADNEGQAEQKRGREWNRKIAREHETGANTTAFNLWRTFYDDEVKSGRYLDLIPGSDFFREHALAEVEAHTFANEIKNELRDLLGVKIPVSLVAVGVDNRNHKWDNYAAETFAGTELADPVKWMKVTRFDTSTGLSKVNASDEDRKQVLEVVEAAGGLVGYMHKGGAVLEMLSTDNLGGAHWARYLRDLEADNGIPGEKSFIWTSLWTDFANDSKRRDWQAVNQEAFQGASGNRLKKRQSTSDPHLLATYPQAEGVEWVRLGDLDFLPIKVINQTIIDRLNMPKKGSASEIQRAMEVLGYTRKNARQYENTNVRN